MSRTSVAHDTKKSRLPLRLAEELYENLQRRFQRVPRAADPVVYEFTDDRALLHQYYRLRELMYRKIHHTGKFSGKEDVHDKIAHILIARRGKLVVGGCRLIVREGDEDFLLPMEQDEFTVRGAFPHCPLSSVRHGEISRFAVMDDDPDKLEIMLALSKLIIEKCLVADLAYAFLKAPGMLMARNWRKIGQAHCGLDEMRICTEIKVPEDADYPEIRWTIVEIPLPASRILAASLTTHSPERFTLPLDSLVH